jgi:hypothetical protein
VFLIFLNNLFTTSSNSIYLKYKTLPPKFNQIVPDSRVSLVLKTLRKHSHSCWLCWRFHSAEDPAQLTFSRGWEYGVLYECERVSVFPLWFYIPTLAFLHFSEFTVCCYLSR